MKKTRFIMVCMLGCLILFSGCKKDMDKDNPDKDFGGAVEIDIDGSDNISADDAIDYEFKDPENADDIEVVPKG